MIVLIIVAALLLCPRLCRVHYCGYSGKYLGKKQNKVNLNFSVFILLRMS